MACTRILGNTITSEFSTLGITVLGYINGVSFELSLSRRIMKIGNWGTGIEKGDKIGGRKRINCFAGIP